MPLKGALVKLRLPGGLRDSELKRTGFGANVAPRFIFKNAELTSSRAQTEVSKSSGKVPEGFKLVKILLETPVARARSEVEELLLLRCLHVRWRRGELGNEKKDTGAEGLVYLHKVKKAKLWEIPLAAAESVFQEWGVPVT